MICLALSLSVHLAASGATEAAGSIAPRTLRCEYLTNPLGIDAAQPRLSWTLEAADENVRGEKQTAYHVLVASSEAKLAADAGNLWDSGAVQSADSIGVVYGGAPLASGERAYWKVRVWDSQGRASEWSEPAWWEMGIVASDDWRAQWIQDSQPIATDEAGQYAADPAPLLRREFAVSKPVKRARAYVTGLGYYELRLNGAKVGDHVLDPAWTAYHKRIYYSTFDVTEQLRSGVNAVGVMLGNGWYNPLPLRMWNRYNLRDVLAIGQPCAIVQLDIEYADDTRESVVTNNEWKAGDGPIVRNSVYLGEEYDARLEQPGWDAPGFDDSGWRAVTMLDAAPGPLCALPIPPIRATRTLKPVAVTEPQPGVFIVDMGRNFAGIVTLKVEGPAGTEVALRYGELLYPDGTLNGMTAVCGQIKNRTPEVPGAPETAFQIDRYTLKGDGVESYTPRFTFHGFRYVEITGFPGTPTVDTLTGHAMNTDVTQVVEFACSNELFNRVYEDTQWTLLSNLFAVQSDCPHREKFGYGGDIVATSEMAMLNYDFAALYEKIVRDFADEVRPNGGFTETAPFVGIDSDGLGEGSGPVGWGVAHPLLVWQLYQYYGNRRLLEEQYPLVQRWVALLEKKAEGHILDNGISDHESLVEKPRALTGTAFYYLSARLAADMARVLGKSDHATSYDKLSREIREAFNAKFLVNGRYDQGTQAGQSIALAYGLVPDESVRAALDALVDDIQSTHDGHLSTGIFGTKYMLSALTDACRADIAYGIANQRTFPGWGHAIEMGATTLWEHWEFSDNTFSHNHPMFGSVSEWFIKGVAGMAPAPDAVGFDKILIRPQPVADLTWSKARYDSVRGPVAVEWRRDGGTFTMDVSVPVGATATVHVPALDAEGVTSTPALEPAGLADGATLFDVPSGHYSFTSTLLNPFADAVAAWHMRDGVDSAGANSVAEPSGDISLGVQLDGAALTESIARGGDGFAAEYRCGWLNAGQGADGELNLEGTAMTMAIRLCDPTGKWNTSLFSKHGGHDRLVYNLFTLPMGSAMDLGFELGLEGRPGMVQVKTPLRPLGASEWHDVAVRFDGHVLQLYVDGLLRDEAAAEGALRTGNTEPCVIGAESAGGQPHRPFKGLIDHAALWNRALTDAEVAHLSGGADEVARRERQREQKRVEEEKRMEERIAKDPHRPLYHFLPPKNWMNDPNGLIHWNGEYHMFYQHNPFGATWGNMHWGHAVSTDMLHWTHLPMALAPDQEYDAEGVFSGCAVNADGTPVLIYTGVDPQVQCIAFCDETMRNFTKYEGNPVVVAPPEGMETTGFRDPCVWREDDGWYMIIGSGIEDVGGTALLYRSSDLKDWTYLHPLLIGDKEKTGTMWECPSFFPVGNGKHVLLVSVHATVLYFLGEYRDHKLHVEAEGNTDFGGHFYAAQGFPDTTGRRLMFGWVWEGRNQEAQVEAGWAGVQSLPRELGLDAKGRLTITPASEVETLRDHHWSFEDLIVNPGELLVLPEAGGGCLEIAADFALGDGRYGLAVACAPDGQEQTRILYDAKKQTMCIDRNTSSLDERAVRDVREGPLELDEGEPLRLRVFLDGSVLEVFANERLCMTSRIYPARQDSVGIAVIAEGGPATVQRLEVWRQAL